MTIINKTGFFGATTSAPSIHPKGIKGRLDGAPKKTEIGETIIGTSQVITNIVDTTYEAVASVYLEPGVYNIKGTGVLYRPAGAVSPAEFGIAISTDQTYQPNLLANAKTGVCINVQGNTGLYPISGTKFQSIMHEIGGVVVTKPTVYYTVMYHNTGSTCELSGTIEAERIA